MILSQPIYHIITNTIMSDISASTQAIRATAILSLLLWTKVLAVNTGLGGAKNNAGGRAPEDTYQKSSNDVTDEAKVAQDRAQRMVNNDLENIPYTMALAWGSVYCISAADRGGTEVGESYALAHIVMYSVFVACRIAHSVVYSRGWSTARSLVWAVGVLCSFGIAINGAIASFKIP
mmetsp:Transcript_25209/g.45379  ORF Transcript_25209/g.45379 Transcript_25209/m.45379 type:complete len:177 (-) Transcript_25209:1609-2139(-)